MKIGALISLKPEGMPEKFRALRDLSLEYCQLSCWNMDLYTPETAAEMKKLAAENGITITALWAGWSGPTEWNFNYGPATLGLVPAAYRGVRLADLKKGSDFAEWLGVDTLVTHVGFLPEDMHHPDWNGTVGALRDLCKYMQAKGQTFLFETGQETPVTLRRVIEDVGTGNLGINLDPANLILYGKGNPIDALDVFGNYVCDIHAKDGEYPTNGRNLGKETVVGKGKVNFPKFIEKLKEIGYDRTLIIEREISGEQQIKDINCTKIYLEELIGSR